VVTPTVTFGGLDYVVAALFVVGILALGFSVKLRSNSILQFLVAGRTLSLPLFVASLVSMWYGGILGIGESTAAFGLGTWVLFGVPYYAFALFYAFFLAHRVRRAEQLSIPERLEQRYGRWPALLGAILMFLLAVPAAHVLMMGVLVQALSGWPQGYCVAIGAVIGISFLYRGGLLADARASLLAFVMMYVGFGVIVGWCLVHHPLGATLASIPNKDLLKWDGGTGIVYVLSLFTLGAWTLVDPGFHQRVTSSASPAIGRTGLLISTGFWLLFDLLSITAGMYAVALYPGTAHLQAFPMLGNAVLPPGLKALFFCGMAGTILSALVGYTLVSGATIGREIVARIKPGLTDAAVTNWSRFGLLISAAVAVGLALQINSVLDLWTAWAGAVVGAMLIPACAAYLSKRPPMHGTVASLSMLFSFVVAVIWMWYGRSNGNEYLEVAFIRTGNAIRLVLPNASNSGEMANATKMAVGTLLPALTVSAVVIALGAVFARKRYSNA
jgi:SSS family solute:Na+ symporter